MAKVKFLEQNLIVQAPSGTEFQELHKRQPELPLKFGCRGGDCGVCAFRVVEGAHNLTKQSNQEKRTLESKSLDPHSYRLACQCAFNGDVVISLNRPTND